MTLGIKNFLFQLYYKTWYLEIIFYSISPVLNSSALLNNRQSAVLSWPVPFDRMRTNTDTSLECGTMLWSRIPREGWRLKRSNLKLFKKKTNFLHPIIIWYYNVNSSNEILSRWIFPWPMIDRIYPVLISARNNI